MTIAAVSVAVILLASLAGLIPDERRTAVQARIEVIALRPTRHPEKGIVTLDFDVTDQTGARVQAGTNQLMIYRRAEAPQTS